jgi:hypothetical protein
MTHQQASQFNARLNVFLRLIILCLCVVFVVGIVAYNGSLNVRHRFSSLQERVETLENENAQLKNNLYTITDTKTLNSVAARLGLVAEKNPSYLNVRSETVIATRN